MGDLMDIVRDCENRLGWLPAGSNPWPSRAQASARLKQAMARADPPATVADVRLALAWCYRARQPIRSPAHLLSFVREARQHAAVPDKPLTSLGQEIRDAITWELNAEDAEGDQWIARLSRSSGEARATTLAEWQASGRG